MVDEEYIDKEGQGDLAAMTPTIVDMLGVFFLKVVIMMNLTPTLAMMIIMVILTMLGFFFLKVIVMMFTLVLLMTLRSLECIASFSSR